MHSSMQFTHSEIAQFFEVNRTTVREWQKRGMPCTTPKRHGQSAAYDIALVAYWRNLYRPHER